MAEIFIAAYDASPASQRALDFAVKEAKQLDATVLVVHILEWLPYTFLSVKELEERHKRRYSEMDRAKKELLDPLQEKLKDSGVNIELMASYGQVTETLLEVIKQKNAAQLFLGRTGQSGLTKLVFGSVVSNMAQVSPVPCTIVP